MAPTNKLEKAKTLVNKGMEYLLYVVTLGLVIWGLFIIASYRATPTPTVAPKQTDVEKPITWITTNLGETPTASPVPKATCPPGKIRYPNYGRNGEQTLCVDPSRVEVITDVGYVPTYFKDNVTNNCPKCLGPDCGVTDGPTIITKMNDFNDHSISCKLCNSKTLYLSNLTDDKVGDSRTVYCPNIRESKDLNTH